MNSKVYPIILALFMGLLSSSPAHAHRTSGLLQASLVEVLSNQVGVEITLLPGMDVASKVFALLDTNQDGALSEIEKAVWSKAFMSQQTVTVNGQRLPLTLQSIRASPLVEMAEGHGQIVVHFTADLGSLARGTPTIVCANHYTPIPSAYQSNGLVPKDPGVRITRHRRDEGQQELTLEVEFSKLTADATRTAQPTSPRSPIWFASTASWLSVLCVAAASTAAVTATRVRRGRPGAKTN